MPRDACDCAVFRVGQRNEDCGSANVDLRPLKPSYDPINGLILRCVEKCLESLVDGVAMILLEKN